jgi:hypothetical protein
MDCNECPVCQCDLGYQAFDPSEKIDKEEGAEVFRLSCGHAFHNGCLCRALRLDNACPVCRNSAVETENINLTINPDGTIEIRGMNLQEPDAEVEDVSGLAEIQGRLESVRKTSKIQNARKALNKEKKKYRVQEKKLMELRSGYISDALELMRRHRNDFEVSRRNLRRSLRLVKSMETEAFLDGFPIDEKPAWIEKLDAHFGTTFDLHVVMDNKGTFGPLKHNFWT